MVALHDLQFEINQINLVSPIPSLGATPQLIIFLKQAIVTLPSLRDKPLKTTFSLLATSCKENILNSCGWGFCTVLCLQSSCVSEMII